MMESDMIYLITDEQINEIVDRIFMRFVQSKSEGGAETCNKTDAADRLGVNRATIYNMIKDGRLKATADGRRILTQSIIDYETGLQGGNKRNRRGRHQYV